MMRLEDEEAVWTIEDGTRVAVGGTEQAVNLPSFQEHPYAQVLRVLP